MSNSSPIERVLVANRGAIARRVIRACNEMGLESVAVYSACDAGAPYLAEASAACPLPGYKVQDTYLNQSALLGIARDSGADAVHPGYGFLAEHAGFAQQVLDAGLAFIGPRPRWLAQMGDKVQARSLMAQYGFPQFPGTELIEDEDQALQAAHAVGYPLMVKPSAGGGGMGMEIAQDADGLLAAMHRARAVSASAFGGTGVYLEKLVERPRHIEYQILADGRGGAIHAFERECSVQRRHQKLIEESPAPGLDPEQLQHHAALAAQICGQLHYDNLGTVETLVAADGSTGFLEMNTRIQVEHGVTEEVTGLDLVRTQIELARGGALPESVQRNGFALEARVYAEDSRSMLPSTGVLSTFRAPHMHDVRVETGMAEGMAVTPYYDAMLAKVIARGPTRELAIGRLAVALRGFEIRGVETNIALLRSILAADDFLQGRIDTGLVQRIATTAG